MFLTDTFLRLINRWDFAVLFCTRNSSWSQSFASVVV